ncbi:metal-dependent transcriptional regulator [Coriobacteriia bacterium Es71-Z0120]|uniref:metal-dependent transcriptional regulator n=1 Tax=Parvivirga hydrogeniphila TaxID=2939460 RepID=UPI002260BC11|nr:metal-dependent transcriptional regulator [Parvivirga hydrogeniphila]MCL4079073.1 metal-dependent transcriptional regulator [Parvivirga hydrogeniphila]
MPSHTIEEYLEAIYKLSENGPVRPVRIAEALGVSGPTVTATLQRLGRDGYVNRPRGRVELTDAGRRAALDVIRRHRLAERFLADVLGLPWEDVHEEACRLEHALSPKVLAALELFLDNPATCPHGHPIPDARGTVRQSSGISLAEVRPGTEAVVVRVDEDEAGLLDHLASLGLYPGTQVLVRDVSAFDGALLVESGSARFALSAEAAARIVVRLASAE